MSTVEAVVAALPYEKDPYPPFQYTFDTVEALERLIGAPFPDDFRWYLENIGWRKLDYDHQTILVPRGEYIHALAFEAVENEVFAIGRYNDFIAGREGAFLQGDRKRYFPFARINGGNPQVSLWLLINLNGEDCGAIWAVRSIGHFDKEAPSQPLRIADDLAALLAQIGPEKKLGRVAEKNNEALFARLLADYIAAPRYQPTRAAEPDALIRAVFERPGEIVFDGARNVEYQHRAYGQRMESFEAFAAKAEWYSKEAAGERSLFPGPLRRREIKIGAPRVFDDVYAFNDGKHGFRLVAVDCLVGDGFRLREHYLLHSDQRQWTLLRRHDATIDDVRMKGVGTLAFDATYKWKLKKKVTPAWSELPIELHVDGEEDALTAERIAFIKDVIARAEFKPEFEAHVFELYSGRMYPEFEAMSDDEKAEWQDCYPKLAQPREIWRLLGKKGAIYIRSDREFEIYTDASWDLEHGLTARVADWRIEP